MAGGSPPERATPLDPLDVIRRRLVVQGLTGEPCESVAAAVGWLGAMQAQEYAEAKWSIAERIRDGTDEEIETAISRGEVVRTHALRPTWHFLARDDARWILRLTRQRVHALNAYWYRRHDLDDSLFARAHDRLRSILSGGQTRTRTELAESLAGAGIEAQGQRLGYLLMHAELEEIICNGPRHGRQHTYALFDDRVPVAEHDERSRESAFTELVSRYFRSHGPATVRDFSAWSSQPTSETRAALARLADRMESTTDEAGRVWYSGQAASVAGAMAPRARAFLIPMYDETIVAYKDLRVVRAHPAAPDTSLERAVVIDGRTVGSWKRVLTADAVVVDATLFGAITGPEAAALDEAVHRFGRFLGREATLQVTSTS
ncbi:hypothetical protein IWX78_001089 [Mycetocola sp. CAN_C7]|uniref:winged helix DNA-binding domain-containing protein n=1 Tax=Mycetocola sp. CAN_C7 TaxID=2787724 RepID=UPI0018C8EEE1